MTTVEGTEMTLVRELAEKFKAATAARVALERARGNEILEVTAATKEKYREPIAAAVAAEAEAEAAWCAERVASFERGEGLPVPLGTVLEKWHPVWGTDKYKATGERGRLEVWREGDPVPRNRSVRIRPGVLVVRFLLKSGAPGREFWGVTPDEIGPGKLWREVGPQ